MRWNGIGVVVCVFALGAEIAYSQLPLEYYLPAASPQGRIIRHTACTLQYNERARQADWVIYLLTAGRAAGQLTGAEDFRPDPELKKGAVQPGDYEGSGYDRGQLVPAGDMRWSKTALVESYYMSVVSPMKKAFRLGLWAELEAQTRSWASRNENLYVVSGPVLKGDLPNAGKTGIPAPRQFYCVLLVAGETGIKGIGFILPTGGVKKPLMEYAVPVDSVENITGIDFFPNLPDRAERVVEAVLDPAQWAPGTAGQDSTRREAIVNVSQQGKVTGKAFTPAVLCRGIGKDGKRCMRMTTNPNGYCWEHQDQVKSSNKP